MDFDPADRPHPPDSGFRRYYIVLCCMMLSCSYKRNGHTPTTCRNSKILGVMFPFGAIGAWSKAQRAEWQHSALHVVDTVVTPVSAASFQRFSNKQLLFCSLQTVFFLLEVFHHKRANLEPLQSLKTSFQAEASCKYQYRGRHPNNGG